MARTTAQQAALQRILASRPDRDVVLALEEPPAPDFPEIWQRLVQRRRER